MVYEHREVVKLEFSYSEELVKLVKSVPGAKWSSFYRMWYIEKRAGLLNEVLNCFKGKAYIDYKALKNEDVLLNNPPAKAEPKINSIQTQSIKSIYYNNSKSVPVKQKADKQQQRVKQYALFI
jgi:hypothetical protein